MKKLLRFVRRTVTILVAIVLTLILVRAFDARRQPDLESWHTHDYASEYRAETAGEVQTWADYMALEEAVFEELHEFVERPPMVGGSDPFNRFVPGSISYPVRNGMNWNRSFEMVPDEPVGGAVLVHGLTDSPYSLRAIAEALHANGYHVLGARMPGHGTSPSGLLYATWEDWLAVTNLAAAHVREQVGEDRPIFFFGYSNGGALVLKSTLDRLETDAWLPDGLVLFSPAVGITAFARLASWHRLLSGIPYFEKFRWTEILPEFDPHKYNSFAKMAGHHSWALSRVIRSQLAALDDAGELDGMPPVLTFQSLVDSTVLTSAIVDDLYERLPATGSELVLYDVNRYESLQVFLRPRYSSLLERLVREDHPYTLTLVTNGAGDTKEVVARRWKAEGAEAGEEELGQYWPRGVYSLSHVAIPFPPDDPVYGTGARATVMQSFALGALQPRGERGVLRVPVSVFMRLRHNPFYPHLEARVLREVLPGSDPAAPPP